MRAIFAGMARSYTRKSPDAPVRKAFCDALFSRTLSGSIRTYADAMQLAAR
jgi:hypothetical protein